MLKMMTTGILAIGLLLMSSRPAHAQTDLQYLFDWACSQDHSKDPNALNVLQSKCSMPVRDTPQTAKSACQVISGTPWTCNTSVDTGPGACPGDWNTNITIQTSDHVLGWNADATLNADASIHYSYSIATCGATNNPNVTNGSGGMYVSRAGNIAISAIFTFNYGGSVTFFNQQVFGGSGRKTCNFNVNTNAHEEKPLNGCGTGACNCCGYGCCNSNADCPAERPTCVSQVGCPCRCPGFSGHCYGNAPPTPPMPGQMPGEN